MAEGQIASPNRPYGDIYFVNTPHLDRAAQLLYQEQRQRQLQQQQENASLDKMLNSDLGKMRAVDQPDYINSYQQWKDTRKKLLFDKKLQKDPYAYNELQGQSTRLLADLKQLAGRSGEVKTQLQEQLNARMKNPDLFRDDAGHLLNVAANTPIRNGGNIKFGDEDVDVFNPDSYAYKGSNTDFGKLLQSAIGTPREVYSESAPVDAEGLQTKITPYSFGNSPSQVKSGLYGAFGLHRAGRDASYQLKKMPQEEIDNIVKRYNEIPESKLKKMGLSGRQDLTPRNPNDDADVLSSLMGMKYAIDNEPRAGSPKMITNLSATEALRQKNRKEMEQLRTGNDAYLRKFSANLRKLSAQEQNDWLDEFVADAEKEAISKTPVKYESKGGGIIDTYEMKLSPTLKKALGDADSYRILPDGDIMYITYERYPKTDENGKAHPNAGQIIEKNGRRPVDAEFTGRMSKQEFKALTGKTLIGTKALNESLDTEDFDMVPDMPKKAVKSTIRVDDLRKKYNY